MQINEIDMQFDWMIEINWRLINALVPDKIKKINSGNFAFKLMENIDFFLRAARDYGLTDAEIFQTVDLWDGKGKIIKQIIDRHTSYFVSYN